MICWVFGSNMAGASHYPTTTEAISNSFVFVKKTDNVDEAIEFATLAITHPITHPLGGHYTCTRVFREARGKIGHLIYCCHKGD